MVGSAAHQPDSDRRGILLESERVFDLDSARRRWLEEVMSQQRARRRGCPSGRGTRVVESMSAVLDRVATAALVVGGRKGSLVIHRANAHAGRMLDREAASLTGQSVGAVMGLCFQAALAHFLDGPGPVEPRRVSFDLNGRPITVRIQSLPLPLRCSGPDHPIVIVALEGRFAVAAPLPGSVPYLLGGDTEVSAGVDASGFIHYVTGWHVLLKQSARFMEGMHIDEFFHPAGGTPGVGTVASWRMTTPAGDEYLYRAVVTECRGARLIHARVVQALSEQLPSGWSPTNPEASS